MIRTTLVALFTSLVCAVVFAQNVPYQSSTDKRVSHLANKILERLPKARYTRLALGRGDSRPWRAFEHANAIVDAADTHKAKWEEMNLPHFNPEIDLAPLIAGITYRESSFRSIVRLDGGEISTHVPIDPQKRTIDRSDVGVMQVRAPSSPAYRCGVTKSNHVQQLLTDLRFAYHVGTCILTARLSGYGDKYKNRQVHRLYFDGRPKKELLFYGVFGDRRGTPQVRRARGLLPLERYNWGGKDLYMHEPNSGYARRVIREYEFFREGLDLDVL